MKLLIAITLAFTPMLYADTQSIPNVCYDTVDGGQFCTAAQTDQVQVFVYNAGWCGPCNEEMSELSQEFSQFAGKPVTFASLSGEGYSRGAKPDVTFLKSWQKKHNIPFVVAGKFGDFGSNFGANGYIPFSAIIDKKGNLSASGNFGASEIVAKVNKLLAGE